MWCLFDLKISHLFASISSINILFTFSAHDKGIFNSEVVPVRVTINGQERIVGADESARPHTSIETLSELPPLFKGGVSTAGNVCVCFKLYLSMYKQ